MSALRFKLLLAAAGALAVGATHAGEIPRLPRLTLQKLPSTTRAKVDGLYRRALANPKDAEAAGQLGMHMHAWEQFGLAESCYQRARTLQPRSFRWGYYLGNIQAKQGSHDHAVASLRGALAVDPDYVPAWLILAESLIKIGEFQEAGGIYQEILKRHPNMAAAHFGLGRVKGTQGELRAAIEHYSTACAVYPTFGAAHYALALAYRDLGDTAKATEHLALHEKNPSGWPAIEDPLLEEVEQLKGGALHILKKATALAQDGRYDESIREHIKALQLDPKLLQAHVNLLGIYARRENWPEAEKHYRAAVAINPNLAEVHYDYGLLLLNRNQHAEAAQSFTRALQINPLYANARNNLGHAFERLGRVNEATEQYRSAIDNNPNHRQARFNLGRMLVAAGKYQEAIEHFAKILTPEDETTPRVMFALGAAYVRSGDLNKGLVITREAKQRAEALGQSSLVKSIEKDLKRLEEALRVR